MNKTFILLLVICNFCAPVWARNDRYILKWEDVLESQEAKSRLESSVSFYFGQGSGPASAERQGGDEVVKIAKGKKSTQQMKDDDIAGCRLGAIEALVVFQQNARQRGSSAVVDLISNYHNVQFSSSTEYECHAGGTGSHVQFKANYAKPL